jgi:nickel/cobalt exporter
LNALTWTLSATAAAVGALHTLAPDHWMPFAALARTRHWSPLRTARTTILCGFGHVTVSAALGIVALFAGLGAIRLVGGTLAQYANFLLIAFGAVYMIWGLHRSFRRDPLGVLHPHDHHHAHGSHDHDHGLTEWSLFALFAADPCVAVIPMILAAASAGWLAVGAVIAAYEVATIATMVVLVTAAHAGIRGLRAPFVDRYGDAIAGAFIVVVGVAVKLIGI